jgi:sugar phosphate isomerase/epimerase
MGGPHPGVRTLWERSNLYAWELAPLDASGRSPAERARLLRDHGVGYAYLSTTDPLAIETDATTSHLDIDAELDAMLAEGVEIVGWYLWINGDDPAKVPEVVETLEAFRRRGLRIPLWLADAYPYPLTSEAWAEFVPSSFTLSDQPLYMQGLTNEEERLRTHAYEIASWRSWPKTPREHADRVRSEVDRIERLVRLAAPLGCPVHLYNHQSWFGFIEHQLAMLAELRERGIDDVGLIYNFSHSSNDHMDDAVDFAATWEGMKEHVRAVNVIVPTELPAWRQRGVDMMRVIQASGWQGRIGLLSHAVEDAESHLDHLFAELDSAVAEL